MSEGSPAVALPNLAPAHEPSDGVKLPVRIIDMGAQLVDVISTDLIERGLANEIIPYTQPDTTLDIDYLVQNSEALIFTGSGKSVHDEGAPQIPIELLDGRVPAMFFCYAAQSAAHVLGGKVAKAEADGQHLGEYGQTTINIDTTALMYRGLRSKTKVLNSHGDSIESLPASMIATGWSDNQLIASFQSADGRIVGTQYHPEASDTEHGVDMIMNFLTLTAGIEPDPSYTLETALEQYIEKEEAKIAQELEAGTFMAGFLSGGVDSRVAAAAVLKAAKELNRLDQVQFYYIDTGHNRVEDDEVVEAMQAEGMPVVRIDRSEDFFYSAIEVEDKTGSRFLAPTLVDADDPELKRLIIGSHFNNIAEEIIAYHESVSGRKVLLVQGTNNSDIIESGGRGGAVIKGHHNVGAMDKKRQAGELVEPLAGLMKYHVRKLAEDRYGLPEVFARRQPFPGVGFSPRIVVNRTGELKPTDVEQQDRLDQLVSEMSSSSVNAHIIGINTVGSKGDSRSLANIVVLDSESVPDWSGLDDISKRVTDKFAGVNRVLFSPSRIERSQISGAVMIDDKKYTEELKYMEEIYRRAMMDTGIDPYLSQHFVASLGVDLFGGTGLPTLVSRMFITGNDLDKMVLRRTAASKETFRTGVAAIPGRQIDERGFNSVISALQSSLVYHSGVIYDLTGKPPGSTELE